MNKNKIVFVFLLVGMALFLSACDSRIAQFGRKNVNGSGTSSSAVIAPTAAEIVEAEKTATPNSSLSGDNVVENMNAASSAAVNYTQAQVKIIEKKSDISGSNYYISSATAKHDKLSEANLAANQSANSVVNSLVSPVSTGGSNSMATTSASQASSLQSSNSSPVVSPNDPNYGVPVPGKSPSAQTSPVGAGPSNASTSTNQYPGAYTPATAYCLEHGGTPKELHFSDIGDFVICQFSDGTECEEWSYYYGNCLPGQIEEWTR